MKLPEDAGGAPALGVVRRKFGDSAPAAVRMAVEACLRTLRAFP